MLAPVIPLYMVIFRTQSQLYAVVVPDTFLSFRFRYWEIGKWLMNLGDMAMERGTGGVREDHVCIWDCERRHVKEYLGLLELLRGESEDRQRLARWSCIPLLTFLCKDQLIDPWCWTKVVASQLDYKACQPRLCTHIYTWKHNHLQDAFSPFRELYEISTRDSMSPCVPLGPSW
jgi:hypothetical protein